MTHAELIFVIVGSGCGVIAFFGVLSLNSAIARLERRIAQRDGTAWARRMGLE